MSAEYAVDSADDLPRCWGWPPVRIQHPSLCASLAIRGPAELAGIWIAEARRRRSTGFQGRGGRQNPYKMFRSGCAPWNEVGRAKNERPPKATMGNRKANGWGYPAAMMTHLRRCSSSLRRKRP